MLMSRRKGHAANHIVRINGKRIDLKALEQVMMLHFPLKECALIPKKNEEGSLSLVLFAQAKAPSLTREDLMTGALHPDEVPAALVLLPSLPRAESGAVDTEALLSIDIIDEESLRKIEDRTKAIDGVEEAAALIESQTEKQTPYHLDDLFPNRQRAQGNVSISKDEEGETKQASAHEKPTALVYGGDVIKKPGTPVTLTEVLIRSAFMSPDRGVTYIKEGGRTLTQTYPELLTNAERVLSGLRKAGLTNGDQVLLQLKDHHDFITVFWGCILGGIIPTPVSVPPVYDEMNQGVNKLKGVFQLQNEPFIITNEASAEDIAGLRETFEAKEIPILTVETLLACEPDEQHYEPEPDEPVLQLLSSGSTGVPKCIRHNHQSILSRIISFEQTNGFTHEDVSLNWMPLDHVGGIVMFHVHDVYFGCQQISPSIDQFIERPMVWLDWVETYGVTRTWAPNFAFAMMNEYEDDIRKGSWDLSTLTYIMNAAEAVVPKVTQRFMHMMGQHGLSRHAMVPAYGMSETSSAIVQSKKFMRHGDQDGQLTIDQTSLTGEIQYVAQDHPHKMTFTEVGVPIPSVWIRIVDEHHHVLPEDQVGRLQVKSPTIMMGYHQNEEANQEVFAENGWFHTGDLGFIHEGRLVLTGREKDIIVINGANYLNYEIEAVVEEVDGVEVTFAAAYGIYNPESSNDTLAVFFVTQKESIEEQITMIQQIREAIIRKIGIEPDHIIPVKKDQFPKTESGKIQRAQLGAALKEGVFRDIERALDLASDNEQTLPDWFFKRTWAKEHIGPSQPAADHVLVFEDEKGLYQSLYAQLEQRNRPYVSVKKGHEFLRLSKGMYQMNPRIKGDYVRLAAALEADELKTGCILHLWNVTDKEAIVEPAQFTEMHARSNQSILYLYQAWSQENKESVRLVVVTKGGQFVNAEDDLHVEKTSLVGLLKTIPQEWEGAEVSHIDIEAEQVEQDAKHIANELSAIHIKAEVAYRKGHRLVPKLEKVDMMKAPQTGGFLEYEGLYLLTGGLGGIGFELSKQMLQFGLKLVLIGRTSLEDSLEKKEAFSQLKDLGGVIYVQADVTDLADVERAIYKAEKHFGQSIRGVLHLAGAGNVSEHFQHTDKYSLAHTSEEDFTKELSGKADGAFVLQEAFKHDPAVPLVFFGSVNGFFGGTTFGAYSAANSFLDGLAHTLTFQEGRRAISLNFSMWDNLGLSKGHTGAALTVRKGFQLIGKKQGLHSFCLGARLNEAHLFIGLDGANPEIATYLQPAPIPTFEKKLFYTVQSGKEVHVEDIAGGTKGDWDIQQVQEIPKKLDGSIDHEALKLNHHKNGQPLEKQLPETKTEQMLAAIWEDILDVDRVYKEDQFFDLGGHSLKATQTISRINHEFSIKAPLKILFESKHLAHLAQLVDDIKEAPAVQEANIPKLEKRTSYELSHAQKRIWFLSTLEKSHHYNILGAWKLTGQLHIQALTKAIGLLTKRHEALRATFQSLGGKPVQLIREDLPPSVTVANFSLFNEKTRTRRLKQLIQQEANRIYDLERGPLAQWTIVDMGNEEFYLLCAQHHIISDAWSLSLLIQELEVAYDGLLADEAPQLPALEIEWTDYVHWENEQVMHHQVDQAYWLDHLQGDLPVLELPFDRPRPPVQTFNGATEQIVLEETLIRRLQALSKQQGTTLFMTMLSAYYVLLHKLSGQTDIIIGSPIAGRGAKQSEKLVGMFVNTLALRQDISTADTFADVMENVKEMTLKAFEHQRYPFDKLVDDLSLDRDLSRSPIFQVAMGYVTDSLHVNLKGLTSEHVMVHHTVSKFDLTLHVFEQGDQLSIHVEYNTDLFDQETIHRYMNYYLHLLDGMTAQPERTFSDYCLMDKAEQAAMIIGKNQTATPYPKRTIQELFEEQVQRDPHRIALSYLEEHMTYQELDEKATQLAAYLQSKGVGPGSLVPMLFDRSFDMIVSVLGIVKSGAAYVPMSPEYPDARIRLIVRDTQSDVIITQSHLIERLVDFTGTKIEMDKPLPVTDAVYQREQSIIGEDQLAYVNYTSGSTGTPKGVMLPHAGVVRLVRETNYMKLGPDDKMLQLSNYAFDAFTFELWGMLLNGGQLILIPKYAALNMEELSRLIKVHQVTANCLPTALFNRLVEHDPKSVAGYRTLLVGGEAMSSEHARKALPHMEGVLINAYGPTENTTLATTHQVTHIPEGARSVPIGVPVSNSTVVILDDALNPVPAGVKGEIYIGGTGLAKGYLHDPERTQERFIDNPFPELGGDRLYRSGDLGTWRSDGTIEYLGRKDNLVKIRGYRIECGEIETALLKHPQVKECTVIAKTYGSSKRLAAYLVTDGANPVPGWKAFLQESLPGYMIPSYFIVLDEMPVTTNGKVDQKALPDPAETISLSQGDDKPVTEAQQLIVTAFKDVLGVKQVGIHDSFFDLGGDSIMSIQAVAKLKEQGIRVDPKWIFMHPAPAQLAAHVDAMPEAGEHVERSPKDYVIELKKGAPAEPRIFFAPPAGGTVMGYIDVAKLMTHQGAVYALQSPGLYEDEEPQFLHYTELVSIFVEAIETFYRPGVDYLAGHSMGGHLAYGMNQRLCHAGKAPKGLIILDTVPVLRDEADQALHADMNEEEVKMLALVLGMGNLVGIQPEALQGLSFQEVKQKILKEAEKDEVVHQFMNDQYLDKYLQMQTHNTIMSQAIELEKEPFGVPFYIVQSSDHAIDFQKKFSDWEAYTKGPCSYYHIKGDHVTMMKRPQADELARILQTMIKG
ncbi:Malonyl CoA-acyl carrier protein transacylase [Bacillus pumilus]|uniref:Long-chain-fatty-acid--CoA ligase n=3 Tax=Bacteria TaxID=2 RepID=A0AB34QYU9_BACPU|nr:non-ribosomal peptide synthetase [Bacillus pumilus]KIL19230.1 Long-chain-fatty-acid--CoA ligase [Bacillus pumilus]RAP12534.1 Malonyl CoA-acyl carrier protein transacylase [Bacillus pumilus]